MTTHKLLNYSLIFLFASVLLNSCKSKASSGNSLSNPDVNAQIIKRGEYLVSTIGCGDCHTPKIIGKSGPEVNNKRILSGYQADNQLPAIDKKVLQEGWQLFTSGSDAAVGPWGVSFAANLTSDQTGIGNWPEENFIRALREGKFKGLAGSRNLLPPMPWENYARLSTEDLKAIYAYLKTTNPVANVVPAAIDPADIK